MQVSKLAAPVVILAVALAIATGLYIFRPQPEVRIPEPVLPLVQVVNVEPQPIHLHVTTQGTVRARTRTLLSAEVDGVVTWVAPAFVSGAVIDKGEVLLRIDPSDYEARVAEAVAGLARARARLQEEEATAAQAAEEWRELGRGEAGPLVLREPQLAEARAVVLSAEAALARARRDLERTEVRAPYQAVVVDKRVDVGQRVMTGAALGEIYGREAVEVRLPVSARELARLGEANMRPGLQQREGATTVVLSSGGENGARQWHGWLERLEGEVAADTRFNFLVVRVDQPGGDGTDGGVPLKPGMFVTAEIPGRLIEAGVELPRVALLANREVRVVDEDKRLRTRAVRIVQSNRDTFIVGDGLAAGDRVVISPLAFFVEGMPVAVEGDAGREQPQPSGRDG